MPIPLFSKFRPVFALFVLYSVVAGALIPIFAGEHPYWVLTAYIVFAATALGGIVVSMRMLHDRAEQSKASLAKLDASAITLANLQAENATLRSENGVLQNTVQRLRMRETEFRTLIMEELGELLVLERALVDKPEKQETCDEIALCCLKVLTRQIALRRDGHYRDVYATVKRFEQEDRDQLRRVFVGLKTRRHEDFKAIVDKYPQRTKDFFDRLMNPKTVTAEAIDA